MSGADHLLFEGAEQEKAEQVRIVDRRRCHFGGCAQLRVSSHRWFFNAFGPILQPNVCVLLDVGTMPGPTSIYHLWKAFDINSNVGGACGEIVALKGKYWQHLLNPLGRSLPPLFSTKIMTLGGKLGGLVSITTNRTTPPLLCGSLSVKLSPEFISKSSP